MALHQNNSRIILKGKFQMNPRNDLNKRRTVMMSWLSRKTPATGVGKNPPVRRKLRARKRMTKIAMMALYRTRKRRK